jgi:hypothetical protein
VAKILGKRLSQSERGVVRVFYQAMTRFSGFSIAERALMPLSIVSGPACLGGFARRCIACVLGSRSARCAKRPVRSIPVHAVGLGMSCASGSQAIWEFSAREGSAPSVFPAVWRQGEWQLPEDRRLGGAIPPGATVVENGDL